MKRRALLFTPLPLLLGRAAAASQADVPTLRIATAWRVPTTTPADSGDRIGVLQIDWALGQVQVLAELATPSRSHGLLPLADGGFAVVANRPGRWLWRLDGSGRIVQRISTLQDSPQRSFNGHVEVSADGAWLYTTETDAGSGQGWVSVRDARSLLRVAQFSSGGIDPHQLLRARDGSLMVANGGIARDTLGRKVEGERMAPSLGRIAPATGRLDGLWTLPDQQLSLRHLAWAAGPDGTEPLLGVALQAEHDSPGARSAAPGLAVWDGLALTVPWADASAAGYAGDIAAGPGGGFVISAQKQGRGLWWHPGQPERLTLVAQLTEPCALLSLDGAAGVALSAARGVALWHARLPPRMLPWPVPLVPDNHWVSLTAG